MLVSFRTSLTTYCHLQTFDATAKRNLPFTEKCSFAEDVVKILLIYTPLFCLLTVFYTISK